MKKYLLVIFVLMLSTYFAYAQSEDYKKNYASAEAMLANKNYSGALAVFKQLDSLNPKNANLSYKIGVCLVNTAGRKNEAIPYFSIAKRYISKKYKGGYQEKKAPHSTFYYAGKAYLIDHQFEMAMTSFNKYKEYLLKTDSLIKKDVDRQITYCLNAKKLRQNPINIKIENLGSNINSSYADYAPVLSRDKKTLFFTSRREGTTGNAIGSNGKYYEDIYITQLNSTNNTWDNPQKISANINTESHEASDYLSNSSNELYIYKSEVGNGDIFISKKVNNEWQIPVPLNNEINTDSIETHACMSPDEKRLFFVSNRMGGFGGKDIYVATKSNTGEWVNATNLGSSINTLYDDDIPYVSEITPGYLTLYFASQGHESMGGFDIFTSVSSGDNNWTSPQNIGYPINTTDDDAFLVPALDKRHAFYVAALKDGYGDQDIYYLTFLDVPEETLTVIADTAQIVKKDSSKIVKTVTDTIAKNTNPNNLTNNTNNSNNTNNNNSNNNTNNVNSNNNQNEVAEIFYTVQVGAGEIKRAYFEKVLDVRALNHCKDGMVRFISGKYKTKEEAFIQRQRLMFLGYEDAFVRTITKNDVLDLNAETGIIKPEK